MRDRLLKSEIYKFFFPPFFFFFLLAVRGDSLKEKTVFVRCIIMMIIKQGNWREMDFEVACYEKIKVTGRESRVEAPGTDVLSTLLRLLVLDCLG